MILKKHFYFTSLLIIVLAHCSPSPKLVKSEKENLQVNTNQQADSAILVMINPYKIELDAEMNSVLIVSEAEAVKSEPESTLGNLVADIVLMKTSEKYHHVDFCLLNKGGLRSSLPKGEITVGNVFELMPFENEIVVLTLPGNNVQEMLNYIAYNQGMPFSGIKMGIKDSIAVNVTINGKPFDPTRNYKVVTSDYLAAGGDKMYFFNHAIVIDTISYLIRNALIDYMREENKKGKTLQPKLDGRIYFE